ncbi:MAG: DUF4143 domain-containing protein, partial [Thermotogota bacterium]|nr:DUF4143 domain-containing protein [Thermotogota bacterium]
LCMIKPPRKLVQMSKVSISLYTGFFMLNQLIFMVFYYIILTPFITADPEKKILRLNEIFSSYLEKDIAGFMKVENIIAFQKLTTLLAAQQGGLVNIQELSYTLGLHRETITRYIHYLEETFVIKRLTPLFSNPRTELSKMPKIYFADPGMRNTIPRN